MTITKIVSGGQTGVDQGALQACQWIDFPYGGWVPKGRLTEALIVRYECRDGTSACGSVRLSSPRPGA